MTGMNASSVLELEQAALEVMTALKSEFNYALATRYLCLTGLVILVYDHFVTFKSERRLIWAAPSSVAKFGFLVNRYVVPIGMSITFIFLSGFIGLDIVDQGCRSMIMVMSILICCSLALGNGLIAMRIIGLWDYNPHVAKVVLGGWFVAYVTAIICYSAALATRINDITWSPLLNICVLSNSSVLLVPAWAAPLAFELFVLVALLWNSIDRPRKMDVTLARALHDDGLLFYVMMAILRIIQLALVSTQRPALVVLGSFFIWALVTTTSSRWLLAWRRVEDERSSFLPSGSPHSAGFSTRPHSVRMQDSLGSRTKGHSLVPTIELSQVVEVQKWAD